MRNLILSLIVVASFSLLAPAQTIPASAEKRISLLTRVMATELQLNEAEYLKLRSLNRERILKSDEITVLYSSEPKVLATKLNEVEANFDKKFTSILNTVQLAAYQNFKQVTEDNKLTALQIEKKEPAKATNVSSGKQ